MTTKAKPEFVPMQSQHLEEIYSLMEAFYEEDGGYPFHKDRASKALERLLSNPSLGHAWVFLVDGKIAGYMIVTLGYSIEFGGYTALLDEIYVRKGMRRMGIGSAAIQVLFNKCDELGIRAIDLEVEKSNTAAHDFYVKNNFRDGWRTQMRHWNRR